MYERANQFKRRAATSTRIKLSLKKRLRLAEKFSSTQMFEKVVSSMDRIRARINSRQASFFYLPRAATNMMLSSPIYNICSSYNIVCRECGCDQGDSLRVFKSKAFTYFKSITWTDWFNLKWDDSLTVGFRYDVE